jgi:hypothetical protein
MLVNKVTTGFVIQVFDTELKRFVSQEFVAGDDCQYEDGEGVPVCSEALEVDGKEAYLPFDMVQPPPGTARPDEEPTAPMEADAAPTVTVVLGTHSTDPEFNGDCDCAVVRLTPELVGQVRRRLELARQAGRQDGDLYELYFWDCTAEFYGGELLEACQEAAGAGATDAEQAAQAWLAGLERDGHALVPPTVDLAAFESKRTECDQMIVRCSPSSRNPEHKIVWTASPRHTDVYVITEELPLAALEGYIVGGRTR